MSELSHVNEKGKAKMVDVSTKPLHYRIASAKGSIKLAPSTIELIRKNEIQKGDVLTVAKIAGIQAAKNTSALIPLCHPLQLTNIVVEANLEKEKIIVESEVKCKGQTGVEMEALTAVSVGLLTIYDMCKAVDKQMIIEEIKLIEKSKIPVDHE
ncbi:MAG: cyclic pyranopterin monophosphate synthase MoaC [Bacteroidales bacterium]|nr:cyclic pyranopterin monophosphate synthase MoaC [Bacteroidales bacterium]